VHYYKEVFPPRRKVAAGQASRAAVRAQGPLAYLARLNTGAGRDALRFRLFQWDGIGRLAAYNCISLANIVDVVYMTPSFHYPGFFYLNPLMKEFERS
jgi:hypothetical protein